MREGEGDRGRDESGRDRGAADMAVATVVSSRPHCYASCCTDRDAQSHRRTQTHIHTHISKSSILVSGKKKRDGARWVELECACPVYFLQPL